MKQKGKGDTAGFVSHSHENIFIFAFLYTLSLTLGNEAYLSPSVQLSKDAEVHIYYINVMNLYLTIKTFDTSNI